MNIQKQITNLERLTEEIRAAHRLNRAPTHKQAKAISKFLNCTCQIIGGVLFVSGEPRATTWGQAESLLQGIKEGRITK